ncbi:hypothetical protein [Bacillus litorisediminis]|nr:hypothetical protein [Bacillus litorisediminis]
MAEQCFYCLREVDDNQLHFVTFLASMNEREEALCNECYQEWLQGIKE